MDEIILRRVTINDIDQLQQIGRETFFESFGGVNTPGDMENYLNRSFSTEQLTAELNNTDSIFYFAELQGNIIGYLKLNHGESQTELKDSTALEIERIYVQKDYQGKNVGQLLYQKAVDTANQKGASYIWLGVWEENPRAISFYKKNGFVEFDRHVFRLGESEQTDIMMRKELS